jgi:putative hemolysin
MEILLILVLIFLNGIFAMSEIALISAKRSRLQQIVENKQFGYNGAREALLLQENPRMFLSTIQVGITSISILSGIVGEKSLISPLATFFVAQGLTEKFSFGLASGLVIVSITFMSVIFGEIIPKSIALTISDKIAAFIAIPMSVLAKTTYPFVWLFTETSELILKIMKINRFENTTVTNEEIKELMGQGTEAGVFHENEQELVANVLHMDERSAVSIMTHRGEWKFIDINDSFEENRNKIVENKLLKVLVVDGDINNILGFIDVSNILSLICVGGNFNFKNYIEEPLYLPQTVTISQVLEQFKSMKKDVTIIINEYGENIGIVSLKDIMSSIIGDIAVAKEEEDKEIKKREDGSYIVDGLIALDKLSSKLSIEDLKLSGVNTISGLVMFYAGRVPDVGDVFKIEKQDYKMEIEVLDMDKNCIDKVLIKLDFQEKNDMIENKEEVK